MEHEAAMLCARESTVDTDNERQAMPSRSIVSRFVFVLYCGV